MRARVPCAVKLEFFDNIFVPAGSMQPGTELYAARRAARHTRQRWLLNISAHHPPARPRARSDEEEGLWVWKVEDHAFFMEVDELVRFRVTGLEYGSMVR